MYFLYIQGMKPQPVLFLILLITDSSISNDLDGTTQQKWSHGQITLTGEYDMSIKRYRYKQQFFATSNNETVSIEMKPPPFSTSASIQCEICSNGKLMTMVAI